MHRLVPVRSEGRIAVDRNQPKLCLCVVPVPWRPSGQVTQDRIAKKTQFRNENTKRAEQVKHESEELLFSTWKWEGLCLGWDTEKLMW